MFKSLDIDLLAKHGKKLVKGFLILFIITATSCASLTSTQIKAVNNLALNSDSLMNAPSSIFSYLSSVRKERGLFYVASLTSAEAHLAEIKAISTSSQSDQKMINKADVYANVLQSYLRALKSISNEARWSKLGTDIRGAGSRIDSVIIKYNALDLSEPLPEGLAKASSKLLSLTAESYMKNRQAHIVKEFVITGDSLVSICSDALIEILKHNDLKELINNEKIGLDNNYLAYLQRMERSNYPVPLEAEIRYLDLSERLSQTELICSNCVRALQSLKRAHHKLPEKLQKRERIAYWYEELLDFNEQTVKVYKLIDKL